jgi:hypothetical protein
MKSLPLLNMKVKLELILYNLDVVALLILELLESLVALFLSHTTVLRFEDHVVEDCTPNL